MKDRVVCINKNWRQSLEADVIGTAQRPVYGEIYTIHERINGWVTLIELDDKFCYKEYCFRPVDDTFGQVVCDTIEQQIEYEKVLC